MQKKTAYYLSIKIIFKFGRNVLNWLSKTSDCVFPYMTFKSALTLALVLKIDFGRLPGAR